MIKTLRPDEFVTKTARNPIGIEDLKLPASSIEPSTARTKLKRYEYVQLLDMRIILAM